MIISASIVMKPRRSYYCVVCGQWFWKPYVRLYGAAFAGDPPYVNRVHPECCGPEVLARLKAAQHRVKPNADHAAIMARIETANAAVGGVSLR